MINDQFSITFLLPAASECRKYPHDQMAERLVQAVPDLPAAKCRVFHLKQVE